MENPALRKRVSTPGGHFTMSVVTAEHAGWSVLGQEAATKAGRSRPPKLRVKKGAATPEPEAIVVSADPEEES